MSLTVTRARIKERCAISTSDYDTPIDNIIADHVPAIEFSIQDAFMAETSNSGLQAVLSLGSLEICCGEFLAQLARELGAFESIELDGLSLSPFFNQNARDPSGLVASGWMRLKPYLKAGIETGQFSPILADLKEVAS